MLLHTSAVLMGDNAAVFGSGVAHPYAEGLMNFATVHAQPVIKATTMLHTGVLSTENFQVSAPAYRLCSASSFEPVL